jgi:LuxR family transcriptional regulator, maltose regulon positive regulatory protein
MDLTVSPLVLTKLRIPAARARQVSRTRLVDLLAPQDGANLVLVCAPAGYGKTTLLAAWAQSLTQKGTAVAWYALDPGDDDPIPFKSYLIASFIQALGALPELTHNAQLLRSSPEIDLQRILPAVINAIISSDRDCVLILDDYHLIGAPAIHSALAYLLEHLPQNLRVAIGSRSDPPLPLARLRARGQLLEIRTAELRFQAGETVQFLNDVMQLDLSPEGVNALEKRTEGWVTGLQLLALALQASVSMPGHAQEQGLIASFTGGHRYLVEYLLEEVVNHQPQELQDFLLSTSILERMCSPLCDQVSGNKEQGIGDREEGPFSPYPLPSSPSASQTILEYLENSNLFLVPLDDERIWYRYHHLFRDFLQTRLTKTQPQRIPQLHRAACEWLVGANLLREAARHAFQTQDWEYAAAFVEQYSFTLIVHSEISTLYEWCSAFPEEVMRGHPMLCILQGMALAYGFRRQNRARVEARLQQADQIIAAMQDRQAAHELIELASVVRTFLAFAPDPAAEPRQLFALAQSFLGAYPQGHAGQFSGLLLTGYAHLALHDAEAAAQSFEAARQIALRESLYFGIVESTFHLARLAQSQGLLRRAAALCRQGQADIAAVLEDPEQALPALGSLDIALGCVLLEQDQLDQAAHHLQHGLDLMGAGMNPYYMLAAYLALFRLHEILGHSGEALNTLDHLEAAWPDISFCTRSLRIRHSLRTSPADPSVRAEAAAWCQDFLASFDPGEGTPGMGPFGAAEAYYLAYLSWAQVQIALGDPQPALAYLQRQLERASANGLKNRLIELSLLQALAWRAAGDPSRAQAALESALSTAQPQGYLRTFDQGPALAQLLSETSQRGEYRGYIERILDSLARTASLSPAYTGPGDRSAQTPFGESLSQRELEVLHLIAQGASNREIAEQLVITVGTVKSHINHILGKLGAQNRTEAVARAHHLGLLEI